MRSLRGCLGKSNEHFSPLTLSCNLTSSLALTWLLLASSLPPPMQYLLLLAVSLEPRRTAPLWYVNTRQLKSLLFPAQRSPLHWEDPCNEWGCDFSISCCQLAGQVQCGCRIWTFNLLQIQQTKYSPSTIGRGIAVTWASRGGFRALYCPDPHDGI